jgi:proteasome lid subunit RPN8/RPN11
MSGSRDAVVVSGPVLHAIVERARSRPDAEIVGFLSGPQRGVATRDVPLTNVLDGTTFLVDPRGQFLAERRIAALGEQIVAIYHSHPCGDATFSALDVQFASAWHCAHIVIGLQPTPEVRAYVVTHRARAVEIPLATT